VGGVLNMSDIKKVRQHFKKHDAVIYLVVMKTNYDDWIGPVTDEEEFFVRIANSIVSQQLSVKAADTIINRFLDLFPKREVTPKLLLKKTEQELRGVGMSFAKARYIHDLAAKTLNGEINYGELKDMDDEQVVGELTKIKGVGRWTVEMFLIFALGRLDVYSHLDQGLRRGMKKLYDLPDFPTTEQAEQITRAWSPYKSYGSIALWESLDNMP
jgi:DNA-3-methyladenine glycosylase II